jgi:hypothetical protein
MWVPLALIAAAVLFATGLPLWQKRGYAIALQQQAMQGRAAADASNALREQLERLTGDYNFALAKKYAYPSALQSVEDVTKILPDDTWLTQLEMKNTAKGKDPKREIVVRGESGNAGRLISLFEDSKLFSEAAPRSPTTKIQPGPGEIFDLGAQLKPLPPPPPVQLATIAESVPSAAPPSVPGAPVPAASSAAAPSPTPPAAPPSAAPSPPRGPSAAPTSPAPAASTAPVPARSPVPPAASSPAPVPAGAAPAPAQATPPVEEN